MNTPQQISPQTTSPETIRDGNLDGFPEGVTPNETLYDIGTARAVRAFTDEMVPEALTETLVWAATRASSPNNTQLWHYVVVRDPEQRRAVSESLQVFLGWIDSLPPPASESDAGVRRGARGLLTGLADVPVLIFVCVEHRYPERRPDERYLWSTVGTAAQNLIVAARSLGLGATLTMLHVANESSVRSLLQLPDGVELGAMIALGWPTRTYGPIRRLPLADVTHHDRW